eukprot:6214172-Pleurochrysis_carterae.AAC.2
MYTTHPLGTFLLTSRIHPRYISTRSHMYPRCVSACMRPSAGGLRPAGEARALLVGGSPGSHAKRT